MLNSQRLYITWMWTRGLPSRKPDKHVRTFVRACMRVHSKRVLEYNAKEKVRGVSAYSPTTRNSQGIDLRARAVSHTYARVDYPIYVRIYASTMLYTHTSTVL